MSIRDYQNNLTTLARRLRPFLLQIVANSPALYTVTTVNPGGRLTLTTALPVTTSDVTAATTLYYTPYVGNFIAIYDGTNWQGRWFTELSLSLSGYTADKNYDIWIYDNAGTLTLDSTVWTSDTARATALAYQNGVLVKSSDPLRRYLGTIRITTTTGQTEDSRSRRYVYNYYNRVNRYMLRFDNATHTYDSTTIRAWNNDTTNNALRYVMGMDEDALTYGFRARITGTDSFPYVGLSQDTFTALIVDYLQVTTAAAYVIGTGGVVPSLLGFHFISIIEALDIGSTSSTFSHVSLTMVVRA